MELVKQFNSELSSLYETKPPISKAKMTSITRTAIKAIKLYKHVVQSVEKFIQKCKPEYKVPGLYVIDSIVRQSRHQFGTEKDVFAPRFARNLQQTFIHLFNCPPEDKSKVIRVLNLWQKNNVFESEVIQPLFDLADPNHPVHKEQAALAPSNGITPVKPPAANNTPKNASFKKEGGTAGWINQLNTDSHSSSVQQKTHAPSQTVDVNLIQQLQQLQTLLLDQQADSKIKTSESDQIKFDKKLLDFDYGEEEDEDGPPQHHQQQQQVVAGLDSLGSILSNPEVLRQLQTLQQTLSTPQHLRQQQQLEMEEKMRKMQEMRQQEEEFDKHLAQTVPNLPFADQCELKPGDMSGFPGMDLSQPPPGYASQQKLLVPPGMMMKPPPSPLEDGEHASSDADERIGRGPGEEGGPSVVVLDSDSPSDSPAHGRRRRRRSRSRSHHRRSRSDSRSQSRSKRKRRSASYDDKDWERIKQREAEKERERERKKKGLPPLKKNHLAVCSTTLWIGHLSKLVQQEGLSDTFGEFGDIVSIDLIPPRGCAFICMNRRQDAHRALQDLRHHKLQGKTITLAWAPGRGMKGKEYKDYWEVEQGVSYIPWSKLSHDIDLELLEEGGMIDEESMPDWLKERQKKHKDDDQLRSQSSSQAEDEESVKGGELDIPVPAPTLPGYIPLPDGPQPADRPPVSQPPPSMPPLMAPAPPLGMMPPFAVPREYTGLLGPMGMAMGPGLMPNVPLGVPPPGMQGLMGNPLMHQQMMSRMPQPVGSPFNPPPGVGLLGPPQLSQIPLPGQDKSKAGLTPLGVPPPSEGPAMPPFTEAMMQLPFTLPPQLQLPGMGMLTRPPVADGKSGEDIDKRDTSSPPTSRAGPIQSPFGQPPPQFSPMSLLKIPPPMSVPPPNKNDNLAGGEDKDERELKDKDYRDTPKEYKDRDKERDRDRDYRNKRDRDYRGDRDYRDRFDKDYRERDKDYRDKDRDRKDRRERSRERDEKNDQDLREKDGKPEDKDRKEEPSKDDKGYRDRNDRDRSRNRDRERDRERERGRDRKWGDRDRERGRDRDREDRRGRDRERERSREMKGSSERDKGASNIQDRLRNMAHEQDRGEFPRGGMEPDNFQGPPGGPNFGPRNEGFHPEGYPPDMHGRHPGGRREGFGNRGPGPRDMFDHRGPPPDGFDPRGPPPEGFGPRGGPPMDNFGPRGPPPDGFGPRGPPPHDGFGPRGPPPTGFGPRGPPPDGFDLRGPPPSGFGPDGFDPRGPPPDFDDQGPPPENFNMRGPPPDNFNRGPLIPDNFGPGGPPPDNFLRGPPTDEFGPLGPPFEGFGGPLGPPGEFQPRIRFELFSRGRGRGQESFRGRGGRGGGPAMFSPRGAGPRGPRTGPWMESQGPSPPKPGFGFSPRGFAPQEGGPERFGPPVFEDTGRGRGGQGIRGRGRGFQGRPEDRRWEDEEGTSPSPKRLSRWSNPSPPPTFMPPSEESRVTSDPVVNMSTIESVTMDVSESQQDPVVVSDADKNPDNPFCPEGITSQGDRSVGGALLDMNQGSEFNIENIQPSTEVAAEERNFPFGGINEDSSSIQMSLSNLIPEPETSSVFQQDSQSMADVEMSNSHFSLAESGQQDHPEDSQTCEDEERRQSFEPPERREEYQPPANTEERGSFADIGFAERISHPEDNIKSSPLPDRQPSMTEIVESFQSDASQRLSNEMHQNIEFSMGDSVSSTVEQSVFETHLETGPEYDPNESSQSIHFEQRPSEEFSENSQPCNQQTFSADESQQNFPSFEEQGRDGELSFSERAEPVHEPLPVETSFKSQHDILEVSEISAPEVSANETAAPSQSCGSGEVGEELVSGEVNSQEQNSSVENSEQ